MTLTYRDSLLAALIATHPGISMTVVKNNAVRNNHVLECMITDEDLNTLLGEMVMQSDSNEFVIDPIKAATFDIWTDSTRSPRPVDFLKRIFDGMSQSKRKKQAEKTLDNYIDVKAKKRGRVTVEL